MEKKGSKNREARGVTAPLSLRCIREERNDRVEFPCEFPDCLASTNGPLDGTTH